MNGPPPELHAVGILAIVVGFLVFFPLMWCLIGWLLSHIGGWDRLAKRFPAKGCTIRGDQHRGLSGRIGPLSYKGVLSLCLNADGFFVSVMPLFRFAHPPLFIPWTEVSSRTPRQFFWLKSEELAIGHPVIPKICLPVSILSKHPSSIAA